MTKIPVLYTFRRCPYAMRARMALIYSGIQCEIREIVFRNKPSHMLEISPKGTVPVLLLPSGTVLEESLDIIAWALSQHDPDGWRDYSPPEQKLANELIEKNDGFFKKALDRYKYPTRYPDEFKGSAETFSLKNRDKILGYLENLNQLIAQNGYLVKPHLSIADIVLFPFVRQFAHVDKDWFQSLEYEPLQAWLQKNLTSDLFQHCMTKYPVWDEKSKNTTFLFPN